MFKSFEHPHRRFNPLTREWILVSPHRARRPWLGQEEVLPLEDLPRYDPECYLCPGNSRAGGTRNPDYGETFVFDNDFPALLSDTPAGGANFDGLLVSESERGICRVICFSPRHDLTLSRMDPAQIEQVLLVYRQEFSRLLEVSWIRNIQIFENRGEMMGCSNPHPHSQLWASQSLPNEMVKELRSFEEYYSAHQRCLLCHYLELEEKAQERIIAANQDFVALVPYWAIWPFESLVLSRRHRRAFDEMEPGEISNLSALLKQLTTRYDNLFRTPFPYSMGFHQRPLDGKHPEWHFHAHYYPPLLRSATVRKFMVGYEMLATPQRDIVAEAAAEQLRNLSDVHYREE